MLARTNYFVGWDVGGWNCDNNPKSRDAIVILDNNQNLVGKPWRGNLRELINDSRDPVTLVKNLLEYCCISVSKSDPSALLAIDIPLGFSKPLIDLLTHGVTAGPIGTANSNPYLHRQTEFFLFKNGKHPLSPIKDMIGSQATKGMHILNQCGLARKECGVWSDENCLTAIETYPSACKNSQLINTMIASLKDKNRSDFANIFEDQPDIFDALICAFVAWLYSYSPKELAHPPAFIDPIEGWVFAPRDSLTALE